MTSTTPGLRERKKARTRWAIQDHAMRLFGEQGYEATTVDQIAAAAEISPSTFFRYFATKEDMVVQDEYDDLFVEGFRLAGGSDDPMGTFRSALRAALAGLDQATWDQNLARARLVLSSPLLRARSAENFVTTLGKATAAFAQGAGTAPDDARALAFTGACMGVVATAAMTWSAENADFRMTDLATLAERVEAALARLAGADWSVRPVPGSAAGEPGA